MNGTEKKALAVVVVLVMVVLAILSIDNARAHLLGIMAGIIAIAPLFYAGHLITRAWPQPSGVAVVLNIVVLVSWIVMTFQYTIPLLKWLELRLGLVKLG